MVEPWGIEPQTSTMPLDEECNDIKGMGAQTEAEEGTEKQGFRGRCVAVAYHPEAEGGDDEDA